MDANASLLRMAGVTQPLNETRPTRQSTLGPWNRYNAHETLTYQWLHLMFSLCFTRITEPYRRTPRSIKDPLQGCGPLQEARLLLLYYNSTFTLENASKMGES